MEYLECHACRVKKKVRATTRAVTASAFMLRCCELGISGAELDEYSIGMVYDMYVEKANDMEKYPYKATQDDMDKFFGEVGR